MRVAILSLNPRHNYGGILQSYALKKVLEGMGHDVRVICKKRHVPEYGISQIIRWPYRFLRKLMGRKDTRIFIEYYYNKQNDKKYQNTDKFVDKYLNPRFVRSLKEIKESEFDAFVVGSDQVWRPRYFIAQFKAKMSEAYLSFTKDWDVKRIAYSASFGVDRWEYSEEETKECAKFLKFFDAVSVREESGVEFCRNYFGINAVQLCDPTLLLYEEDYMSLIPNAIPRINGLLFVYCLDENGDLYELVKSIAKEKGLTPFYIQKAISEGDGEVMPSVETWISLFKEAEYVITDSYHGCIFSMIFKVPFLCYLNEKRGLPRFQTLARNFGLNISACGSYYIIDQFHETGFDEISMCIKEIRSLSLFYLNQTLIHV